MATILVVDDHESLRRLLRVVLEGAGHEVLEASNGRYGLALYRERVADLVITDIAMPVMSGLELISELMSSFLDVKVIAMSGNLDGMNELNVAKRLGARQTFQKPFDIHALLRAVENNLAQ
jgi:two-component system response regulator (stage 0 sporulation protein F)